jgi:cation-transporting ATPase E
LLLLAGYIKNISVKGDILAIVTVIKSLVPQGLILMSTLSFALGAVRIAKKNILVQKINAIESMSHLSTLCMDKTGTLGTNTQQFYTLKVLSATNTKKDIESKLKAFVGSVSDKNKTLQAIEKEFPGTAQKVLDELPFTSERKTSAIRILYSAGTLSEKSMDSKKSSAISLWLGAPEILGLTYLLASQKEILRELQSKGLRVLLFAESQKELKNSKSLKPLAFIVLKEELRPNIKEAIKFYEDRNVKLKLLSGDHPETVYAIAKQVEMEIYGDIVNGDDLQQLSSEDFKKTVLKGQLFGRLIPKQKQQIIKLLQETGEFVGMIGDGVNDILALKQANIGVALNSGAAVSKDVSDIILLKNSFFHLPAVSKEGDRIIYNIKRVARLFLTKNIYSLFFILFVGFIGLGFPLSPRFITWIDFLTIGIPATFLVALSPSLPKQSAKNFVHDTLKFALVAGIIISFFSVLVYASFYLVQHQVPLFAKTASTSVIILMDLFIVLFVTKLERKSSKRSPIKLTIYGIIAFAIILNVIAIYWPFTRDLIGMASLDLKSWAIILAASGIGILTLNKLLKRTGF